jgi:alpha-amylase
MQFESRCEWAVSSRTEGPNPSFLQSNQVFSGIRRLTALPLERTLLRMFPTPGQAIRPIAGLFFATCLSAFAATDKPVAIPRFTHPGAGQTFYFALTDRFANGDTTNDTGGYSGGREEHGFDPTDVGYYHGGDLAGLSAKLDYLEKLGITAVWLTPPFSNKPVQDGSAGYHGYWINDFLKIDPHLGTNESYKRLVADAHARGMRVFMDIIPNHTSNVIQYPGGARKYTNIADAPYRDAHGQPFDVREAAFNGLGDPADFPTLSADASFAYKPIVPPTETSAKNPAWLNDVTLYHNRGHMNFKGENAVHGDFGGLDDLFTEHPRVVQGMIEIYSHWVREFGIDGVRIDTLKHVNAEFWQAFSPALREAARSIGRPDFIQFGEVFSTPGDSEFLSEFSTGLPVDTSLDFGFWAAVRRFISDQGPARTLADFFAADDYYTDHDSIIHTTTTFLGNHDDGRWGFYLQRDNPDASLELLASLVRIGHGLLYLSRGQPVLYYGDEQGMIGRGGNDKQARETMFASRAADYRNAQLLGTTRTGADDKFDSAHPFYQLFSELGALRAGHRALRTGAMITRPVADRDVFAFSRIDRNELVEYLVVLNNSRTTALTTRVPTSQASGAALVRIFSSDDSEELRLVADEFGNMSVSLAPLQFAVWRAESRLGGAVAPEIAFFSPAAGSTLGFSTREIDGQVFASRQEIRADVSGGDGVAEVTFAMRRASRPDQLEWLGTDDAPPYRIFWRPSPDLEPGESLEFIATVDDLRGNRAAASVGGIKVAPSEISFGIRDARTPFIASHAPTDVDASIGREVILAVNAEGTAPLEYQWLRDGHEVPGATESTISFVASRETAGSYRVLVRNLSGTAIGAETVVTMSAPE